MKKIVLILFITNSLMLLGATDSFQDDYLKLLNSNKFEELEILLKEWKKSKPQDVELYIAYFNYHLALGRSDQISLGDLGDGSIGIYNKQSFEEENRKLALNYLDKALLIAPDRLDVYFGQCSVLSQANSFKELSDKIIQYLNRSQENGNRWYWSNNVSFAQHGWDGEEVIFSALYDYLVVMFNHFNESKEYLDKIFKVVSDYYPSNVVGLNLAARYYDLKGEVEIKIEILKRAYSLAPDDYIIVGNLAYSYELLKEFDKALFYYNIMLELNNSRATDYANSGIERINQNR